MNKQEKIAQTLVYIATFISCLAISGIAGAIIGNGRIEVIIFFNIIAVIYWMYAFYRGDFDSNDRFF